MKRIIIDEENYTEANYPFTIKPNFSTLGSITETLPQGPIKSFMFDDSLRDHLGFNARTLYEEYNLSHNPVDIISFDKNFIEADIARGMIFRDKRSGNIHNWSMTVNPGFKFTERFAGGFNWYISIFDNLNLQKYHVEIDTTRYPRDSVLLNYEQNDYIEQ